MSFESDLEKFLARPAIQKQMKAHYKSTGGSVSDIEEVKFYVREAIQTIVNWLPIALRTGPQAITYDDLEATEPKMNEDGDYVVELRWNPKAIHRESLWRPDHPEGIENIVALFSTGYTAQKPVYGFWRGHNVSYSRSKMHGPYGGWTKSLTQRPPDDFIQFAVNLYNSQYGKKGVTLTAPEMYY